MHPEAYHRESAQTQHRTVEAARKIGSALGLPVNIPELRVHGDHHAIEVSGLCQRQALADFLELIAGALEKPATASVSETEGDSAKEPRKRRG